MTAEQIGTMVSTAVAAGFAVWRALHADKVASRVEAKTDAKTDSTEKRLESGNSAFQTLRDQNTAQAERIAALEIRVAALEAKGDGT